MSISFTPQFDENQRRQLCNQEEATQQEAIRSLNRQRRLSAHDDPYADQKKAFEERKKIQRGIVGTRPTQDRLGGIIGAMDGMINYNAEGLAFKALSLMAIDLLILIFNVPYIQMKAEFKSAQEKGIAYEANENGEWPTIYKTNERGELDYDQPYNCSPEEIPMIEVYENGYAYPPTLQQGFVTALAEFRKDMSGDTVLSREEWMLLTRAATVNESAKQNEENSMHRTQREAFAVQQQRGGAPRPVPRGGH